MKSSSFLVDPRALGNVFRRGKFIERVWVFGKNGRLIILWETRTPKLEMNLNPDLGGKK